jgi:hypothetical protein
MNASKWHRTPVLLAAALGAVAATITACGGSAAAPPVGAPPASRHTAVERAATLNWLAMTNQMWTKDNFAAVNQVTVGEARTIYRAEQRHTAGDASRSGRTPFRLTGLSITVPCHGFSESGEAGSAASGPGAAEASGAGAVFVAYGDTDVFTLGQSMRPEAMVFEQAGGAWKLAAVVNGSSVGAGPRWPALCPAGAGEAAAAVLAPADYPAALARALDHAATGVAETARAAAPFAVNSFFAGPDSINVQFARESREDRLGGVMLAQRFTRAPGPALALPLAGGRGYWLVGVFSQTTSYGSAAGVRQATWPDGNSVATPHSPVVHHETDTFVTTYAATDPLRSAGRRVMLDGFFGWPLTSVVR